MSTQYLASHKKFWALLSLGCAVLCMAGCLHFAFSPDRDIVDAVFLACVALTFSIGSVELYRGKTLFDDEQNWEGSAAETEESSTHSKQHDVAA